MNKSSALAMPLLLLLQLTLAAASPIRYDQRQDGDSNVDARLQNFFVVLAPSNMGQLGGASLLDLASKAVPLRLRPQAHADSLKQREEVDAEHGQETKEGKAGRAVGAVAIPAAILQSPLAKLHPEVQAIAVEEVLIAESPLVALKTPPAPAGPAAVPMLVAVPVPEVAPERPAAPPTLLPMNAAGLPAPLGDKPAPPAAIPAAPEAAAAVVAEPAAAPAAPVVVVAEPAAADPVAQLEAVLEAVAVAAPALAAEAAQPAVETNQVEPDAVKKDAEGAGDAGDVGDAGSAKVHLIGTGIEECGPERVRNDDGVCVDAVQRD